MKTQIGSVIVFIVIAAVLSLAASRARANIMHYANPSDGQQAIIDFTTDGQGANAGGPFTATLFDTQNAPINVWKTFCLEADGADELFWPYSWRSQEHPAIYEVENTRLNTATDTGNVVTDVAKWLYYQSLHDPSQLVGYVGYDLTKSAAERLASDSSLQLGIWNGVLHNGSPLSIGAYQSDSNAKLWYDAAVAAVAAGWGDANKVRVLNPVDRNTREPAQSLLYETVGYDGNPVPEPGMLELLAVSASATLICARCRHRN
jgi:hypothetical protein